MPVYETPGPVLLRIDAGTADVHVEVGPAGETVVDAVPLRDDETTREALHELRVEAAERGGRHEVVVEVPQKAGGVLRLGRSPRIEISRGPRIELRLRCPAGSDLEVVTSGGDVQTRGRLGAVTAKSAGGDVLVEAAEGAVEVTTASGDVSVREAGGACMVRTGSGDVGVVRAHDMLTVHTVSGDVQVGEAAGPLSLSTVSGDQQVRVVGGNGDIRVQTVSGDVHLGVRPGLQLWIDASSVSGTLRSELDVDDGLPAETEGPAVELHARTVSGDVRIARAAVPA
jgi:hypothetical protein